MTVAVLSCACSDFGLWTEWHVRQERLRSSCMLPFQFVCGPWLWHVRQVSDASRGDNVPNRRMDPGFAGSSTCALPGPWHVSHPCLAAGLRGFSARPCIDLWMDVP